MIRVYNKGYAYCDECEKHEENIIVVETSGDMISVCKEEALKLMFKLQEEIKKLYV